MKKSIMRSVAMVLVLLMALTVIPTNAMAAKAKVKISKCSITLKQTSYTYTGSYIKPTVTVKYNGKKLTRGTDYTLSYNNNKKVGKATVRIKGKGNYTGTTTKKFTIKEKPVQNIGNAYTYMDEYSHFYVCEVETTKSGDSLTNTNIRHVDFSYGDGEVDGTFPAEIKYGDEEQELTFEDGVVSYYLIYFITDEDHANASSISDWTEIGYYCPKTNESMAMIDGEWFESDSWKKLIYELNNLSGWKVG
ncbi:MAG: hypothetical protein K6A30_00730 [Lachnospiraceae bacterium]|nr:hypothetical protein [Lachnospiraceae bacterium]